MRDGLSESRNVADAGHGPLENRITRAVIGGQWRALGERAGGTCAGQPVGDGSLDGLDDSAGRDKFSGQSLGERDVLAYGSTLGVTPADVAPDLVGPGGCRPGRRRSSSVRAFQNPRGGEDAYACARGRRDHRGFTAVATGDTLAPDRREG